jgi:PKD repeat protein
MLKFRPAARAVLVATATFMTVATCQEPTRPPVGSATHRVLPVTPALSSESPGSSVVLVGAGDIASCTRAGDEQTAALLDGIAGTVFALGDNAYSAGSVEEYTNCYGPTWGRHKDRTRPTPGDKDYATAGAPGYFGYFGAAAGDPAKGYYSYDAGDWHVVVLNSKISMSASSPQVAWLKADLAASSKACTIAYWHKPRFYSNGVSSTSKVPWDVLYMYGVEVILNSERRNYERFAPQNPDGVADPAFGIRQFVVGTGGGSSLNGFGTPLSTSEVRITGTLGVLKLTLGGSGYGWEFVPVAGQTATDVGSDVCHGSLPPVARAGGPYRSESTISFNGSTSSDPQGDLPLAYEWDFGDGATGTTATPTHSYAANGNYTASLVVVDAKGNRSNPTTATVTIENIAPVADAGVQHWVTAGQSLTYAGSFTDYAADSPWSYRINWGDGSAESTGSVTALGSVGGSHIYASPGTYTLTLTVTDADGGTASDQTIAHVLDPVETVTFLTVGDIADCRSANRDELTARIVDAEVAANPRAVVFTVGDNAYPSGRAQDYANCYHPTWGRHKDRTWASIGNHEYDLGNANPSWDYFGDRAGPRGKGYYSVDLADWHIIVLNDNSGFVPFTAGSEQDLWLQADLAANTKRCTLAIWHQPRFYSYASATNALAARKNWKILWDRLWAAGAELALSGHDHRYERFAPMRPDGTRDDAGGIRQFILGTGGEGTEPPLGRAPTSEAVSGAYGIMKLTLRAGAYDWEFKPIAGESFTDSGSGTCH